MKSSLHHAPITLQASALPAFAFRRIMHWLDREFWNLYKMATAPRPVSSGESARLAHAATGQLPVYGNAAVATSATISASASAAGEWSSDEQRRLEAALVTHSSSLDPKQRWTLISADVGSKTAGQCIARFKFIRDTLKSGGSVAAAEAKAALASSSSDKLAPLVKISVPAPVLPAPAPAASAAIASESSLNMPPPEMPDDLLTMTGVIGGAGMCAGALSLHSS